MKKKLGHCAIHDGLHQKTRGCPQFVPQTGCNHWRYQDDITRAPGDCRTAGCHNQPWEDGLCRTCFRIEAELITLRGHHM